MDKLGSGHTIEFMKPLNLIIFLLILTFVGCSTTPEQEAAKRDAEMHKIQQRYASYTTPELQLKRQEIAAKIPQYYWGTGLAGAIQSEQIEKKRQTVAEIDRELLRRAESGDTTGQQKLTFIVASTPPGARIEGDGKFLGIAPTVITFTGNLGATSTLRATPATLDRPALGFLQGFSDTTGSLALDDASIGIVSFVGPNTPASQMGLLKGDKIIAINGVALPENTGSKESAMAFATAWREQLSTIGFGAPITLKIVRDSAEMDVKGATLDQLEGVFYVQEKQINPMQCRNGVVMFDLRMQTGTPITLGTESYNRSSSPRGASNTGTGFAVAEGGYILTCQHVIEKSQDIEVRDASGGKHAAKVVASDADNDLCLLHVADLNTKPIPAAPPNSVSVGQSIYLLGFPMEGVLDNQTPVAGSGVVASLRGLKGDPRHLQVTLPINPGNSGGPVLDTSGRWVGVASHKLNDLYSLDTTESIPQGINFAIKGSLFMPLLDSIPEVKMPIGNGTNSFTLEESSKKFSESVLLVEAKH
jgi:S1-C subfamily serine protease